VHICDGFPRTGLDVPCVIATLSDKDNNLIGIEEDYTVILENMKELNGISAFKIPACSSNSGLDLYLIQVEATEYPYLKLFKH